MSKENDYQDLDDWDDTEVEDDDQNNDTLLDSIKGTKDARRRLDDLLEERRLREQMTDDF
ncbi:MAG: PA3496 family putative envelope integrity protein [Guyparkeria sp.]|uniref:PA3496 family putative envelope integrity protein n=1 Tax=Guyparkeria sp. TaxID=2035736 RepID=UPI00397CF337